jgi:hypothetical protein
MSSWRWNTPSAVLRSGLLEIQYEQERKSAVSLDQYK